MIGLMIDTFSLRRMNEKISNEKDRVYLFSILSLALKFLLGEGRCTPKCRGH